MQVTVTNYKACREGRKVTIDTNDVMGIYNGIGVFDGATIAGWNVLVRERPDKGFTTLLITDDDVKLLRA